MSIIFDAQKLQVWLQRKEEEYHVKGRIYNGLVSVNVPMYGATLS